MRSTKSPNLELIGERKIKDYFNFSRDVPFEIYLIRINNMMGMIKNMIGNKLYSRSILFCTVFLHDGNCKVYNNYHRLRRHDRCPFP